MSVEKAEVSSGGSSEGLTREYFSQLPKSLIRRLYSEKCKLDFQAFGYEDQYLQYYNLGLDDEDLPQ